MSRILASAALASLFLTAPAFAEEAKKDEKNVVPYGIIQAKYHLLDTSRDVGVEGDLEILRAGLRGSFGVVKSGIEVEFMGNNTKMADNTTAANGTTSVRAGWLGLALPTGTTFKIGRVRPAGAASYGTDQTSTPQQFSGVDGARVTQDISLPGDGKITVGYGLFNSLRILPYEGTSTKNNMRNGIPGSAPSGSWNKSEKAWIGSVAITHSNITAQLWYGAEKNAIVKTNYTVTPATASATDALAISGVEVADIAHMEGSLGYDRDNYGFGVFFEQDVHGSHTAATLDNTLGKLSKSSAVAGSKEVTQTVYGLGANLNSKEFGATNLFAKDDAITFGAGFTRAEKREAGVADADQKGADVNEITASVGYAVNNMEVALGFANYSSANKVNTDSKGENVHSLQRGYINAAWEF